MTEEHRRSQAGPAEAASESDIDDSDYHEEEDEEREEEDAFCDANRADNRCGLLHKRTRYTLEEKSRILDTAEKLKNDREACRQVSRIPGYEHVSPKTLRDWRRARQAKEQGVGKRMGRPVNELFQQAVMNHLIYTELTRVHRDHNGTAVAGKAQMHLVANVAFSRDLIILAAEATRKEPPFCNDPGLRKLKFSDGWASRFLARNELQ